MVSKSTSHTMSVNIEGRSVVPKSANFGNAGQDSLFDKLMGAIYKRNAQVCLKCGTNISGQKSHRCVEIACPT